MDDYSLYCTFDPITGWRTVIAHQPALSTIRVLVIDGRKLMRIPSSAHIQNGRFLNPKTVVLKWVREHRTRGDEPPESHPLQVETVAWARNMTNTTNSMVSA